MTAAGQHPAGPRADDVTPGRHGLNVVVDVGHHDAYAKPAHILPDAARRLAGLPALVVGVRCPLPVIMQRRNTGQPGREGRYRTSGPAPTAFRTLAERA